MVKRKDGLAEAQSVAPDEPVVQEAQRTRERSKTDKTRKSVYIYLAMLFAVVVLFTLLSYFIQQRNNSEISTLNERNVTAQENIGNLQSTNIQLQADNELYKKQVSELQSKIAILQGQITEIRQEWQTDVQSVRDSDRAAYSVLQTQFNDLQTKYNGLVENNGDKVKTHD